MARTGTNHKGGRPKGSKAYHTIQAENARKYIIETINKHLEPILTAQIEAAKGTWYEERRKGKQIRVYQRLPDTMTGKYLIDQTAGRAKETLDINEETRLLIDF